MRHELKNDYKDHNAMCHVLEFWGEQGIEK